MVVVFEENEREEENQCKSEKENTCKNEKEIKGKDEKEISKIESETYSKTGEEKEETNEKSKETEKDEEQGKNRERDWDFRKEKEIFRKKIKNIAPKDEEIEKKYDPNTCTLFALKKKFLPDKTKNIHEISYFSIVLKLLPVPSNQIYNAPPKFP